MIRYDLLHFFCERNQPNFTLVVIKFYNGLRNVQYYHERKNLVMYRSNRSFNIPPGILRAFDTFAVPGGMGKLNHSLDFMWNLWELSWRTRRGFSWKDCAFLANWLRGKGLNKLRAIFEGICILIFLILDSGFECMIVLSCAYNSYILTYCKLAIQFNNKRLNYRGQLQWNGHEYRMYGM